MIKYEVEVYANGDKCWYLKGKIHREDGPAIEWADGSKAWFLNDRHLTEAEHKANTNPTQIVLTKRVNATLHDALDEVKGWTG